MTGYRVTVSLQEDKGTYVVRGRVFDPTTGTLRHKSKSLGLRVMKGNKRQAEREMIEVREQWQDEQDRAIIEHKSPKLSQVIDMWLSKQKLVVEETSYLQYERWAAYIKEDFGDMLVCDITRKLVQNWVDRKIMDLSHSTVNHYLTPLRGAMRYAVINEMIEINPMDLVEVPRKRSQEQPVFNRNQVNFILDKVLESKDYVTYTVIILAGIYGLRREEICGLRWLDIDFTTNTMRIQHIRTQVCSKIIEKDGAKSKHGVRSIKLTEKTAMFLRSLMDYQVKNGIPLDKVCCHDDATPLVPNSLTAQIVKLLDENGIEGHLHTFRHTAATIMSRELTVKQLQTFLGHATPRMSLKYVHYTTEDEDIVFDALDRNSRHYKEVSVC